MKVLERVQRRFMRMGPGKGDGVGKWYSFLLGRLNKVMKGRGRLDRGIPSVGGIEAQ